MWISQLMSSSGTALPSEFTAEADSFRVSPILNLGTSPFSSIQRASHDGDLIVTTGGISAALAFEKTASWLALTGLPSGTPRPDT